MPHSTQLKPDWSAQVPGGHGKHSLLSWKPGEEGCVSTGGGGGRQSCLTVAGCSRHTHSRRKDWSYTGSRRGRRGHRPEEVCTAGSGDCLGRAPGGRWLMEHAGLGVGLQLAWLHLASCCVCGCRHYTYQALCTGRALRRGAGVAGAAH